MFTRKRMSLSGLFILLTVHLVLAKYPCNNIPLSISSVDTCNDGVCSVKQLVQTRVDLGSGKSVCFKLDGDKVDLASKVVNVSVVDSWVSYPVRDCYTSDDPQIDIAGFCRCRLAGSVDCSHCSALPFITNDTICVDGSNRGTGCIGSGTHCVKAAFFGGSRYKICDIGKPKIFVDLLIYNSAEYILHQAELEEDLTIKDSEFELTFYDIDKPEDIRDKSVVLDLLNPEYMYLVPDEEINSIHSRDPNKLGWYRVNETITPKIQQLITVNVRSCADDEFAFGIGVARFRDSLSANPNWFLENKLPGAIWLDVDAEFVQSRPAIYDPPLPTLNQGSFFLTTSGDVECFGLMNGNTPCQFGTYGICDNLPYLPSYSSNTCVNPATPPNLWTNYGLVNMTAGEGTVLCSEWIPVSSGVFNYGVIGGEPVTGCDNINQISIARQCNVISGAACPTCAAQWGIQVVNYANDSDGALEGTGYCDYSVLYSDTDAWISGTIWPVNRLGAWKLARLYVEGNVSNLFYFTDILDAPLTQNMYNLTSDHIITSNVVERTKLSIEFKNIHIQFVNENIFPEIDSVKDDPDFVKIWAHSRVSEGSCLLMVDDDIAPSKLIDLTFKSAEYKLPLKIDKFKGEFDIEIRCYKNVAKAKAKIEIDRGGIDFKFNTVEPDHVKELKSNDDLWDKAATGARKTGNALSRFFSHMYNLTGNAVADFFLGILLSILFFICCVVALILLYYILKRIFCYFTDMYKMKYKMLPQTSTRSTFKKF